MGKISKVCASNAIITNKSMSAMHAINGSVLNCRNQRLTTPTISAGKQHYRRAPLEIDTKVNLMMAEKDGRREFMH